MMRSYKLKGIHTVVLTAFFLAFSLSVFSQKTERISANARTSPPGSIRIVSVDLSIRDYSSVEDRDALVQAFSENGSQGLVDALDKLGSKGRIAITGTLGFDVNYISTTDLPDGSRMIRFVTDRPITFAESWASPRSVNYRVSIGEIILRKEKNKSSGKLFPAAEVKLNKNNEIEIESFQEPWDLTNIRLYK